MVSTPQEVALLNPAHEVTVPLRDAVESAAETRLRQSSYPEVGRVRCEFRGGTLTLWGRVSTYFLKQVAQALVFGVDGVVGLDNQLEVVSLPTRRWPEDREYREPALRGRYPR